MLTINATIEDDNEIEAYIESEENLDASIKEEFVTFDDYEKLKNLPSLDGRKIIGDIPELDPTVPRWAKENKKPEYNAQEIGAVDERNAITLEEIASWFD